MHAMYARLSTKNVSTANALNKKVRANAELSDRDGIKKVPEN